MDTPNTEQLAAVRDYALAVGPEWKASLTTDWLRAGTAVSSMRDRYHLLQQVRNKFGPAWLATFEVDLSEVLAADVARYVKELNTDSVVSYSHETLRYGRKKWGKDRFDAETTSQLKEGQ
jgi:hypothetical protein